MKKFTIEKVKWSWAKAVKNKDVYRDHELIRTPTKEEALEAIEFLMSQSRGLTYTITVYSDGEYLTYFMRDMPCLGGLVKYADTHGKDKYYMNPYFPRDIYVAFPEGDIIYIGYHREDSKNIPKGSAYNEFILSQESPWISAFGSQDTIIFKDNHFILTNMDTDPTVFYSLMRLGGLTGSVYDLGRGMKDWAPKAQLLYSKTSQADPRRLAGQQPIRISGGTWAQGFGYTRCYNESIFKTKLPDELKDFAKHTGGYPNAPFEPTYFLGVMKDKFGIEKLVQDQKTHDALVEAWDFFKEESKALED